MPEPPAEAVLPERSWRPGVPVAEAASAAEVTPDAHGVACHPAEALRAGDCLLFDDRVLHRGLANGSSDERWVAYFGYRRERDMALVDETHFEASRSLFGYGSGVG